MTPLLIAVVIAFALASCGGDNDSTVGSEPTPLMADAEGFGRKVYIPWGPENLSKAEYVKRGNEICEKSWAEILDSHAQNYGGAVKGRQFAEATKNAILSRIQFWFDHIAYLGTPPGEKDRVKKMLIAMQLAVFHGEGEYPVNSPQQLSGIFAESNRLVRENELDGCVVGPHSFRPVT